MELTDFIAFDVETATSKRNSLCQIGYAIVQNLEIIDTGNYLVKPPGNEYEARNSVIHKITALDTKKAPEFPLVWEQIRELFETNILVAHNASFDIDVLGQTLDYYDLDSEELECLCTYQLTDLSLEDLCESLRVSLDHHHDALADAIACGQALIEIIKGHKPDKSLITTKEKKWDVFDGYENLHGDVLKPNLDVEDKDNPFYNKKVVFTGVLDSIGRTEAANILKGKGADIDTNVTKRTKYVIMGAGAGPSKIKKIEKYNLEGAEIEIIGEEQFLKMINYK